MLRSPITRWLVGIVAFIALLGVLRFKPWHYGSVREMLSGNSHPALQELKVGYLPVTCHLTCPVTDFATRTSTTNRFESQRFTDFPTVVESVKGGRLDATFMIAPLAMKLREQGVPVKIVYLGHRDRSEEHTSELQSPCNLVCRLLLEKKKNKQTLEDILH